MLIHIVKLTAAFFGVVSAGCWAVSACGHMRPVRRALPWMQDQGVPWFQTSMNALAAGAASIAAIAQVFLTLGN